MDATKTPNQASMAIATTEPASVVSGDTVTWQKTLADYPAGEWTLKYRLLNAAGKVDITATASGADHLVAVSSETTATWAAGDYNYTAWVEKTGERHTVGGGRITIAANLAASNTYDGRSPARRIYEGLLAAYEARVDGGQGYVAEYEVAGRRMKFTNAADWLNQINHWKAIVASEDRAAKIAAGMPAGNRILVRF